MRSRSPTGSIPGRCERRLTGCAGFSATTIPGSAKNSSWTSARANTTPVSRRSSTCSFCARPMQFADPLGDIEIPVADVLEQRGQFQRQPIFFKEQLLEHHGMDADDPSEILVEEHCYLLWRQALRDDIHACCHGWSPLRLKRRPTQSRTARPKTLPSGTEQ